MHFYLQKGKKILYKLQEKVCAFYVNGAIVESTAYRWKFWSGKPKTYELLMIIEVIDDDQMEMLIKNNTGDTTWDITDILYTSYMCDISYLKALGYMNCYNVSIPHDFFLK